MNLKKKIPVQVYDCQVEFQLTDDILRAFRAFKKRYNLAENYDSLCGLFIRAGDMKRYHILISLDSLNHNTISHEVYHGASQICAERSIEDEETRAWLDGYLTGEIYKFLDKKKQTVKHG